MSRTTKSINNIKIMLDSISGLTGEVSNIVEEIEKYVNNKIHLINNRGWEELQAENMQKAANKYYEEWKSMEAKSEKN